MKFAVNLATIETKDFGAIPVRHRDCPLCGRNNDDVVASRYSEHPWEIKECIGCRFVYIDRAADYSVQFEAMAWERTTKFEEPRRAEIRPISYKASKRTRFRLHLFPRHSTAGYIVKRAEGGTFLIWVAATAKPWPNSRRSSRHLASRYLHTLPPTADDAFQQRGGCAINAPCAEGLLRFSDGFFAAASLRSYLEHEAEPLRVLRSLQRVLAPAGVAVVKVPNFGSINRRLMGKRWCGFRYPDHLNYFTPKTLGSMAAKAGFDTGFGMTGRIPTSDNIWAGLIKRTG